MNREAEKYINFDQKLYPNLQPSAPDLELLINKKIKDLNSFNHSCTKYKFNDEIF